MNILIVCLGNICRSPVAQGVLQQLANKQHLPWLIDSAGTNGLHNGEPPHPLSQRIALQHGVDISQYRSRKMLASDIEAYDTIYVMGEDVMEGVKKIAGAAFDSTKVHYFLNELNHNSYGNNMPDPWYGNQDGFEKVQQLINETCQAIINKYKIESVND